jgi:hypothetical protein
VLYDSDEEDEASGWNDELYYSDEEDEASGWNDDGLDDDDDEVGDSSQPSSSTSSSQGVDGQIIDYLTSELICTYRHLSADWTVTKILDGIARANPSFHVLLDCGALITGMSNYEVAKYLWTHGLPLTFDGVVFLKICC